MRQRLLLVAVLLTLAACGGDEPSSGPKVPAATALVPAWAQVSKEQIAEAERLRVPVAFENAIGMRFVLILAGTFPMGSAADDREIEGFDGFEEPRTTEVHSAFYLGIFEVTNEQFRSFRSDHHTREIDGSGDEAQQPIGSLHFEDTTAFVEWLGKRDVGRAYRLPTEAEWEYACRAGTKTRYWWGADEISIAQYANVRDLTWNKQHGITKAGYVYPVEDGYVTTAPVGSFKPNPWGLYDMLGNAWELCEGRYDPTRGGHVARGGSCADGPIHALPTTRMWYVPAPPSVGFRLAASLEDK